MIYTLNTAIVLPIKPKYAKRILSGEKKFEFRKRLCSRDITCIYLYATAPVQRVLGYATVTRKISGSIEGIWNITRHFAGIEYSDYLAYFKNCEIASAYEMGETFQFEKPLDLKDFGIDHVPQGFVYVDN